MTIFSNFRIGWPADLTLYRLLTDWGGVIGGVSALIAGGIAYRGTLRAARAQVSGIFADIERPAIFVEATRARWHTSYLLNIPFVEYCIHNHGRTAAIIRSRKINAVVVETVPKLPPCEATMELHDWTSIVANGKIENLTETIVRNDDTEKLERVRARTRKLIFSGVIEYEGPFGDRKYVIRFGWIFDPSNPTIPHSNERFVACQAPGYNVNT